MNTYEMIPLHDSRKSFYGKARIIELDNGTKQLQSYNTIVCQIDTKGVFTQLWDGHSTTTSRHIKEFKKQFGGC